MSRWQPEGGTDERILLADAIRKLAHEIEILPESTASLLKALSFVLVRVADADRQVSDGEARHMERTLVQHTGVSVAQAALVVEIAKHRARVADHGTAYAETRLLRNRLDDRQRVGVLECLHAIAAADGDAADSELDAILQVAAEIGFTRGDVAAFRRRVHA